MSIYVSKFGLAGVSRMIKLFPSVYFYLPIFAPKIPPMAVNLYIVVPTIAVAVALLLWLIYRNLKDERKFERDINAKDEIPAVKEEKEKEGM